MKRLKRRTFAGALLFGAVLAGVFATGNAEDEASADGVVKLTYLTSVNVDTEGYDVNDNPYINYIEEQVGVDIEIISAASSYDEKVNTIMASGDLPDYLLLESDKVLLTQFAVDDLLLPLDDYIPETTYLANVLGPDIWEMAKVNGRIMGIPMQRYDKTPFLIYIRQQWLDNLGIDAASITTIDDWYDLYVKFRDNDPDNNGQDDTYGLIARSDYAPTLELFQDAFDAAFIQVINGQVTPNYIVPGYKDWLVFMNKLYEEKLLDPEYVVTPKQQFIEKQMSNKYGSWMRFWSMQEFRNMGGEREELAAVLPPMKVGDGTPSKLKYLAPIRHFIGVTKACEHPEKVVEIMDWAMSEEGGIFIHAGIEGFDWDMVDGEPAIREDRMGKNLAWRFITLGNQKIEFDGLMQKIFAQNWGELGLKHLNMSAQSGKLDEIAMQAPAFPELADYDLESYVIEFRDKAIMGRVDIEAEWDAYVDGWKRAGGSEWIKLYTDWYNAR